MKKLRTILVILIAAISLMYTSCGGGSGKSSGGTVTIRVEIFDRGTDGGNSLSYDNAWTDWINEKVKKDLGFEVEFVAVGRWSETTDIVNLMASQSAPDVCYTYDGGMISNFRDLGGILDLAPYIDQYLPDLKTTLGPDPVFAGKDFIRRNADQATGAIYSIPSARVALAQRNIFIRKDWLDKLGIAVPTNLQQFHDALVAFRDRDPGGVGANRVVPFMQGDDARWGLANFMNNSIQTNQSDRDRWANSVAERNLAQPGYKEGVRLMNAWYNERLIYQDFPLADDDNANNNLLKSGVVGAFSGNWDLPFRTDLLINAELAQNVPGASFIPVDLNLNNLDMMDKVGLQMFIPAFSSNHIQALQYLNWLGKFENYNFLQIGQEGVNHVMENGVPRTIDAGANHPWKQNSTQNIDYTMPLNGIQLGNDELNARVLALGYGDTPAQVIVDAYAASVHNARAPVVTQYTITVNQYNTTLQDKCKALLAQSITASPAQFDNIYDTLYRDWLASGAQEVLNERASLWR